MTMTEVFPMVQSLPHADKLRLMQFLVIQLAREEDISLSPPILPEQKDSLWGIVGMAEGEKVKNHPDMFETALLSEATLSTDWSKPEEKEAWSHLQ